MLVSKTEICVAKFNCFSIDTEELGSFQQGSWHSNLQHDEKETPGGQLEASNSVLAQ